MTEIIPFEDLNKSTITMMVYSNPTFDLMKIFSHIPITHIDSPLRRKKKRVDKKKLKAPYESVISLQYGLYIRGIRLSKEKKYWCLTCQIEKEGKKFLTVKEVVRTVSKDECIEKGVPSKIQKIYFVCSECEREFEIYQLRGIVSFLNQVTIVLSISHNIINVMMFKDSLKLTGNKTYDGVVEAIMIVWENYINSIPNAWSLLDMDAHFMLCETLA